MILRRLITPSARRRPVWARRRRDMATPERRRRPVSARCAAVAALAVLAALPESAGAADPGRWREVGHSRLPILYYQGVTSDPQRRLWFDGVFRGLYRTDDQLREQARQDLEIPLAVTATEGYNHIGDITWDAGEGGRVLLPLECYTPGAPNGGNTCGRGAIGVADPTTLAWRYRVNLDPAEIPKAMWAEVSPDGQLLWTSSGQDLLAYRTADVRPAAAAGPPLRAVRRLPGAVPPTGVTGAAFYRGRLFLAGQDGALFEIWSVNLANGSRRLEVERHLAGESEGLDVIRAFGGVLHWMVTPFDPSGRPPTYGPNGTAFIHLAPVTGPALRLSARPRTLVAGRRTRVRFVVRARRAGRLRPVAGATVRADGRRGRTNRRGVVLLTVRFERAGRHRARASKRNARPGAVTLRVRAG